MKKEKLIVDIIQKSTSKIPSNAIRNDRILRKFFDIVPQTGYISKENFLHIHNPQSFRHRKCHSAQGCRFDRHLRFACRQRCHRDHHQER